MVQTRSRSPLVVLAAVVVALSISVTMLLPRASAFLMQPRMAAVAAATRGRQLLRMGLDRSSRPTPRGPKFEFRRFSSSGDDFAAINPQTLNWEKVGPEEDVFISALSQNGHVNVKVVSAKNLVEGMRKKRELGAVATETMGRVMLSAMLVAHGVKDEETLQLTFNGNGLARGVMAISDGACNVRSWIGNPDLEELRDPETGRANIKAAVGGGTLQVVKNHPTWRIPYNGVVEIASGEIAPDVAFYLASSEQKNTAIGVGLHLSAKSSVVESAGGFYIEMMPGVEEDSILQIEANLSDLKEKYGSLDPGQLFAGAKPLTPYKLVKELLYGLGVSTAAETLPQYKCTCSEEKVFRALKLLSEEEIDDILAKEGRIEAKCEFCAEVFHLDQPKILELRNAGAWDPKSGSS